MQTSAKTYFSFRSYELLFPAVRRMKAGLRDDILHSNNEKKNPNVLELLLLNDCYWLQVSYHAMTVVVF